MNGVRRVIAGLGRAFVTSGVLVLLFVIYELYGTSWAEAREQSSLKKELQEAITGLPKAATPNIPVPTTAYVPLPPPPRGEPVAMIKIDKLNLVKAVVEGVDTNDLKKGPGHYDGTPMPGEAGNVAIAGHRTTYGAPFYRINELVAGDLITVTTKQGEFKYEVAQMPIPGGGMSDPNGQKIVGPEDNFVLDSTEDNRLTLTTCHPRYSAAQRLIVFARLVGDPLGVSAAVSSGAKPSLPGEPGAESGKPTTGAKPAGNGTGNGSANSATVTTTPGPAGRAPGGSAAAPVGAQTPAAAARVSNLDVSGDGNARGPVYTWGVVTFLIGLFVWALSRRWKKWPAYVMGTPVFLVALYFFFENFSALLPANV